MKIFNKWIVVVCIFVKSIQSQRIFGVDLSELNPFASPPMDKEFQTRRYSCNARVTLGVAKSCICIIKVVKKKQGNLLQSLGCDSDDEASRNLMVTCKSTNLNFVMSYFIFFRWKSVPCTILPQFRPLVET